MRLYPRLRLVVARELADHLSSVSIETAEAASATEYPDAAPAPTGGQVATRTDLQTLQQLVRREAAAVGYPNSPSLAGQQAFDARIGRDLLETMDLSPSEASHVEVWAFIGCVLLPDVVRWRFSGNQTNSERFIGGARGLRNTFGRLWWRAYLLDVRQTPDGLSDPLERLNEDELVQITERPGLSGYQPLASALAHEFSELLNAAPPVPREALMRQATKRLLRTLALVSPAAMESEETHALAREALEAARQALLVQPTPVRRADAVQPRTETPSIAGRLQSTARAVVETVGAEARRMMQGTPHDGLTQELAGLGLETVDRRNRGGRLWVIGDEKLGPSLETITGNGRFVFAPNGSSSTGRRPGWYYFETLRR